MQNSPIKDWKGKNIMIIGDIMIDRYLYGKIDRISPEAPVPILDLNTNYDRLGGAANVALNIKALGAHPFLLGCIGMDNDAFKCLELLKELNLDSKNIIHDKERQTTVKTRIWAASKQILRVDQESTIALSLKKEQELFMNIQAMIQNMNVDAIVMQDYNKGVLTPYIIQETIKLAKIHRIPVIVDPKNENFFAYKGATLFKPNLKEIREQTRFDISPTNIEDLRKATTLLHSKLDNETTMITLSEHGVYLKNREREIICPTQQRNIVDVCGAGDTVLSIAALAVTISLDIESMGILANLAGGQVCESIGVIPVNKDKLEEEYIQYRKKSAHKN